MGRSTIEFTKAVQARGGQRSNRSQVSKIWVKREFFGKREGIIWGKSNSSGTNNEALAQNKICKIGSKDLFLVITNFLE